MLSIRALKLIPAWVAPNHLVSTARIVLEGHRLRALGVIDSDEFVGVVTPESLATYSGDDLLAPAIQKPSLILYGEQSIRDASEQFVKANIDIAPVLEDGKFLGIVTANMLLQELGRSWDPLTELSWSDQLREWGIEKLKRGNEVIILFVDLDEFGQYNKRYGHIVGDRVLKRVAEMLSQAVEESTDVLVRYGGDEFAIGTIRNRADAESFAEMLKRKSSEIFIGEAEDSVEFTIGIQGGKRTKERENIHYAATLDNLINLASKDCIAQKNAKQTLAKRDTPEVAAVEIPATTLTTVPIRVVSVYADDHTANSLTQVILSIGESVVSGVSSRMGRPVIESIASATAKALERKYPDRRMTINDIHLTQNAEGERLVTVSAQIQVGEQSFPVGGVKVVHQDLYGDIALATLQAFQSLAAPANV
ncbi:MAG TPA: GGDEF domain-containing protein [Fimbriimonadaceae bacterium]|nr:GGDEF domain-containing protein [Fimbriimonadaceae bacterium]